jgi:hypothetical protein
MKRVSISMLVLMAIATALETVTTSSGMAASLAERGSRHLDRPSQPSATATKESVPSSTSDRLIVQLFYPPVTDPQALRVPGRGRASEPANAARLVFKFGSNSSLESPPEGTLSYAKVAQASFTQESLKPIVDALVASGVPSNAIRVTISEPRPSALPFPFPSTGTAGGAEIAVMIEQPTRDRIEKIVTVASQATAKNKNLTISSVGVQYSAKDCQALERAAYQAAVQDAQNRASAIAEAMGGKMRKVGSVAEPFYNAYLPGCNSGGNLPFGGDATSPYDPNAPVEVEVTKEIFVTFPID